MVSIALITAPASGVASDTDQSGARQALMLAQPTENGQAAVFGVETLTAREEADLRGLTERALDDQAREGSLESYWKAMLPSFSDQAYRGVSEVFQYEAGTAPATGCEPTPRQAAGNASYCRIDESIAYDEGFVQSLYAAYGDVTPLAVLAHEWGHHVQKLVGFPMESKAAELQADCYAGMYLRHLDDIGLLEAGDTDESLALFRDLGDDRLNPDWNPEWFAEGVHGNSHERSQAQGVGFATGDPRYCEAYGDWADRPTTPFANDVSVRRAPGTRVRAMPDGSYQFEAPDAEIVAWASAISTGTAPSDALAAELRARLGQSGALELGDPQPGMLETNAWATGEGARLPMVREAADGTSQPGLAEIQLHPSGVAEVFAAFAHASDETSTDGAGAAALDALLWGYCDPRAPSPVNCPAERPIAPNVEVAEPPSVPRDAPQPAPEPRVTKSKAQRWQDQLMTTVRNYRDCTRWTKRLESKWNGTPNAYTMGAVAAVACGTPDTIRPIPGVRQLALFRFKDAASLDDYWRYKLAKIGKLLRQTNDACTGGKQGLRSWSGTAGSGTIACYLDGGRAKLRWTNERNNTYGVVDATHKNIRRLADWWRSADI